MPRDRVIKKSRYHNGDLVYADPNHPATITLEDHVPDDTELYSPDDLTRPIDASHAPKRPGQQVLKSADVQSVPVTPAPAARAGEQSKGKRPSDNSPV